MRLMQNWLAPLAVAVAVASAPAHAETIRVTIEKLVYAPATVKAKVGDTIEWVNHDILAHTATVKGGWEVMIPPKQSGSFVVKKAETIDYYCRFHPNMKGRIEVTN